MIPLLELAKEYLEWDPEARTVQTQGPYMIFQVDKPHRTNVFVSEETTAVSGNLLYMPLTEGSDGKEVHILDKEGEWILGRKNGDIPIDNASLSKTHAVIRRSSEGEITIMDLNSSNGTIVNGRPLNEEEVVTLTDRDHIVMGSVSAALFTRSDGIRRLLEHVARYA